MIEFHLITRLMSGSKILFWKLKKIPFTNLGSFCSLKFLYSFQNAVKSCHFTMAGIYFGWFHLHIDWFLLGVLLSSFDRDLANVIGEWDKKLIFNGQCANIITFYFIWMILFLSTRITMLYNIELGLGLGSLWNFKDVLEKLLKFQNILFLSLFLFPCFFSFLAVFYFFLLFPIPFLVIFT